jgi:thermostable 8-oxoguanine DNA glycosylase
MVDPVKVTKYDRNTDELEEFLLFCIAVAGKNATRTAIYLERLLEHGRDYAEGSPFNLIKALGQRENLSDTLKCFGFGCYNIKSRGLLGAANSGLDLRSCTVEDLERLYGVGMKSARYFVLHSRENAQVGCLDTHVLKWMAYYTGFRVPSSTPSRKKYLELEQAFLRMASAMGVSPAVLDLRIWNKSRGTDEESLAEAA